MCLDVSRYRGADAFPGGPKAHLRPQHVHGEGARLEGAEDPLHDAARGKRGRIGLNMGRIGSNKGRIGSNKDRIGSNKSPIGVDNMVE